MTPKVSVVIPAYNAERFLGATLASLRGQTFRDFETVVVDDGSADGTGRIAGEFLEVRLLRQANAGVAAARNAGVRETRSEWVAFLDADDLWMPGKLEEQLEAAANSDAGAVFCDLQIIGVLGEEIPQPPPVTVSLEMEALLLHEESIPQATSSTVLVRRSVLEAVGGYDENLATMADWDLLLRLRRETSFAHVPRKLAAYRRYPGSMSRSVPMLERESRIVLDKAFGRPDLPEALRRLEARSRAWNDLVLCGSYFQAGRIPRAVRFGLSAVARNPRLIGRILETPVRRMRRLPAAPQ